MVQNISPKDAYEWLKSGEAMLIDVREPDEFGAVHIAYASSMPLGGVAAAIKSIDLPAGRKLIFQCKKGRRGEQACMVVQDSAVSNEIFNIEGGIDAWEAAGLPLVSMAAGAPGGPKISIFRQVQMIVGSLIVLLVMLGLTGLTFAFILAGIIAGALAVAGLTGWCGLAMLLQKMPWNKPS